MDLANKLLLLLCVLLQVALAEAAPRIVLDQQQLDLSDFRMGYHIDPSRELSYSEVRELSFAETGNRATLGTNARVTWYRLVLDNATGAEQSLFMHLPHAYHLRAVDIYEERDGDLIRSALIDLDQAEDSDILYRGTVVYPLTLAADESVTLYLRSFSYSHQWFAVDLFDQQASRLALVSINTDIALMVGMLLALVFYNALLYFATSKKESIFYSLYLISGLTWIALSYGLIASVFGLYGEQVFQLNISLLSMPIFLLLFMMTVFETRRYYPTEHRFLQGLIVLIGATFVWGLFDISAALKPASSLAALMMVVTFSVSVSLYRKGHPLVKYFLIGHSFFVLFNGIAVLFYKGLIAPSYVSSHGVGIGIMLESLTLAFVISHRIKLLEEIRASQDELKRQAATDPLTRLNNRRFFFPEADMLLQQARVKGAPVAALALDIDHFKQVNDRHGHACGDQALVRLADTLRECSRASDLIARFGGEEFVLLLPDAGLQEALHCAERIRSATEALELPLDAGTLHFTVSIGVAVVDPDNESIEAALKRADQALYAAKAGGRNQICCDEKHDNSPVYQQ